MAAADEHPAIVSQELLLHVADQLKVPLLQIARRAELGHLQKNPPDYSEIQTLADSALQLIDSYTTGIRLALDPAQLEPVSVSSVLYDSYQDLSGLAKMYGVGLELDVGGRFGPVLAHRAGLQSALVSLGVSLIEALPAHEDNQLTLKLATHRSRYGIVAGIYSDAEQLNTTLLQRGQQLYGQSRQPFLNFSHTSGAGIFVADSILKSMQLRLRASRHRRLYGLGTVLQSNPQLQLV